MGKYDSIYSRDGWKCRSCGMRDGLHCHHIIYRSHQGSDEPNNLITLCAACHLGIHDGNLEIIVLTTTETDAIIRFVRKQGWKP